MRLDLSGLLMVVLCLAAGVVLRRGRRLPPEAPRALNGYVMYVALPALVVWKMHELARTARLDASTWIPISMAWIQYALAGAFVWTAGRKLGWGRGTMGAVMLTAGLGNTSFVGFPLLEALYGPEALPVGILTDQPGSFLVFSTLGVLTAAGLSGEGVPLSVILRRVVTFPPMLALIAAFALSPWALPHSLVSVLDKVSASLIPVALVSVGLQLRVSRKALARNRGPLFLSLAFKLVAVPLAMTLLYYYWVGERGFAAQVTIIESAMAPMITGAILADESGLDPELANLMVGVGIPLSLLTVPAWAQALRWLTL